MWIYRTTPTTKEGYALVSLYMTTAHAIAECDLQGTMQTVTSPCKRRVGKAVRQSVSR